MNEDQEKESSRASWDSRALEKGASLEGVLYRGLPDELNQYLHDFHCRLVVHKLLPHIPPRGRILDLGSGFGRISLPMLAARDDVKLVGVDFSRSYCEMYAAQLKHPVICADINALPLRPGTFDGIVAITSFMYVAEGERERVLGAVNELLKPGGYGLYIDPGHEFKQVVAKLRPSTMATPTGGNAFRAREYKALNQKHSKIVDFGGAPGFSGLLPALYLAAGKPALFRPTRSIANFLDRTLPRWWRFSIHRWVLVQRPAAGQTVASSDSP